MWLWSRRSLIVWIATLTVTSSGCGYALAGRGNFLPSYIRTIGIPNFENYTSFFQMAQLATDKVRTEFIGRGNYKIVPEATGADAVLVGAITNVMIMPTNFSAAQQASRYTITVTANIQLPTHNYGSVDATVLGGDGDDKLTLRISNLGTGAVSGLIDGGAGFDNFNKAFHDPLFWNAIKVTFEYVVINIGAQTVVAMN